MLRLLAASLTTVLGVVALARLGRLEIGPLLFFSVLTPYAVIGAIVAAGLSAWARSTLLVVVDLVLLVALAWTQVPMFLGDSADSTQDGKAPALTAMTVNLAAGKGGAQDIVGLVRLEQVDVLALQELTPEAREGLRRVGLDELLPFNYTAAAPGIEGVGVWSRYPVRDGQVLPGFTTRHLQARLEAPDIAETLSVVVVHPAPPGGLRHERWNLEQRQLRDALGATPGTVLAIGDFNATADLSPLRLLDKLGYRNAAEGAGAGLLRTWGPLPGRPPIFALDHVLVRGSLVGGRVATAEVPGADHQALIAELRS